MQSHNRKITPIIIGARGWLGTTARHLIQDKSQFNKPIVFGSAKTIQQLSDIKIYPLTSYQKVIDCLPVSNDYIVINFAYLTKDKIDDKIRSDYLETINNINTHVASIISLLEPLAFLFMSSGAASMVQNGHVRSKDMLVYGQQKLDDETFYGDICSGRNIRYLAPRLFNIGGPFINKLESYVLSNFILQSLTKGQIQITANRPVYRSYCHVFDLINVLLDEMTTLQKTNIVPVFEVGGAKPVEMADLAQIVATKTNLVPEKILRHDFNPILEPDYYVANNSNFQSLLSKHSLKQTLLPEIVESTLNYILHQHPNQTVTKNSK